MIRLVRAYRRGYARGQAQARAEAIEFLRAQAASMQGEVGDRRRRGALNHAADRLRDGRPIGHPEDLIGVRRG